jgi:hypothetical protein
MILDQFLVNNSQLLVYFDDQLLTSSVNFLVNNLQQPVDDFGLQFPTCLVPDP